MLNIKKIIIAIFYTVLIVGCKASTTRIIDIQGLFQKNDSTFQEISLEGDYPYYFVAQNRDALTFWLYLFPKSLSKQAVWFEWDFGMDCTHIIEFENKVYVVTSKIYNQGKIYEINMEKQSWTSVWPPKNLKELHEEHTSYLIEEIKAEGSKLIADILIMEKDSSKRIREEIVLR